jgi:hypothetical protein
MVGIAYAVPGPASRAKQFIAAIFPFAAKTLARPYAAAPVAARDGARDTVDRNVETRAENDTSSEMRKRTNAP